jgi:hypothetical protein
MTFSPFKKYSVVVSCFSRAELLDTCLNSITKSKNFDLYNLVVLHQTGHEDVSGILQKYEDKIDMKIVVNSQIHTPIGNINWNRLATYEIAFELFGSEFVFGIEEDVEIASDSLKFLANTYEKFKARRDFRGANLGSVAMNGSSAEFNKLRYGLHGQAGMITKSVWKSLPLKAIKRNIFEYPLDAMFESYLKTGFMTTPIRSKYLDRGWGGTHAPKDSSDRHYLDLQASFLDEENQEFSLSTSEPNPEWRQDCVVYNRRHNLFYWFLHEINLIGLRTRKPSFFKVSSKLEYLFQKMIQKRS